MNLQVPLLTLLVARKSLHRHVLTSPVPKRPRISSWSEAATQSIWIEKPLHVCHLAPLADKPHLTAGGVWGTRGPEFKSRRPDERKPRISRGFLGPALLIARPVFWPGTRGNTLSGGAEIYPPSVQAATAALWSAREASPEVATGYCNRGREIARRICGGPANSSRLDLDEDPG
jgi:hypothetical protein